MKKNEKNWDVKILSNEYIVIYFSYVKLDIAFSSHVIFDLFLDSFRGLLSFWRLDLFC